MTPLQWALLIFAVLAVVAIYVFSRRDRRALRGEGQPDEADAPLLPPARERQLDIFGADGQQFDEFGVGRPRRIEPRIDPATGMAAPAAGPSLAPHVAPTPKPATLDKAGSQKIVALLIAEREGTQIQGPQLHEALAAQGLEYGARQIYHRLVGSDAVFSVASLLKPGHLDPASSDTFTTPGLTLFMVLPGPVAPAAAIRDMIGTAERLAAALHAEVFDAKRKPLSPGSARALQMEVEAWARLNPGA